ncbi:hypothetical protein ACJJTC_012724 [Scirpophaga incertulas]
MVEEVEGGATLAWRLLATLEGSSLLLATSALLAYTARKKLAHMQRHRRPVKTVLLTNSTNKLGKELKLQLEARGCVVRTLLSESGAVRGATNYATSGATSGARSGATSGATSAATSGPSRIELVDALVIVGAETTSPVGLQAIADLVSEDIYNNLQLLERLSVQVRRGGSIAWACTGMAAGNFRDAGETFDLVLKANLQRVANM